MAIKITFIKNHRGNWHFNIPARCCNCGNYHITHSANLDNHFYLSSRLVRKMIPAPLQHLLVISSLLGRGAIRWLLGLPTTAMIPPETYEVYYCQTCFELIKQARHLRYLIYLFLVISIISSAFIVGHLYDNALVDSEWIPLFILATLVGSVIIAIISYRYLAIRQMQRLNPHATHHNDGALCCLRVYFADFLVIFPKKARFGFSVYATHPHYAQDLIKQNQVDCQVDYNHSKLMKMQHDYEAKLAHLQRQPHQPGLFWKD